MTSRHPVSVLMIVLGLALSPAAASAGEPAAAPAGSPEELARRLIHLTGGGDLGKQVMTQMVGSFRQADPGVPEEFWDEFMASVDPRELEDLVVPIYVENLSVEEMSAAIDFYSSPAGRSIIRKLPVVLQESMAVGQRWGQELARKVTEKLTRYRETHPRT
jgi:hypothetical protein